MYKIKPFTNTKKNNKLSKAPFENFDHALFSKKASYNGFRTTEERLPYWIQAIFEVVYKGLGNKPNLHVIWLDDGSPIDLQIRIEDMEQQHTDKDGNISDKHLYTIWIYLTTGGIALQGPCFEDVINDIFPKLKDFCDQTFQVVN